MSPQKSNQIKYIILPIVFVIVPIPLFYSFQVIIQMV